jgi:hypothetical protein
MPDQSNQPTSNDIQLLPGEAEWTCYMAGIVPHNCTPAATATRFYTHILDTLGYQKVTELRADLSATGGYRFLQRVGRQTIAEAVFYTEYRNQTGRTITVGAGKAEVWQPQQTYEQVLRSNRNWNWQKAAIENGLTTTQTNLLLDLSTGMFGPSAEFIRPARPSGFIGGAFALAEILVSILRADEIGQELGIPWQIVPLNFVSTADWQRLAAAYAEMKGEDERPFQLLITGSTADLNKAGAFLSDPLWVLANWKFALGPSKALNTAAQNQIRDADLLRLDEQWSCIEKRKNWSGLHFRQYQIGEATDTAVTDTAILFSGLQTLPSADRLNHFMTGLENLTTNG